MSQPVTYDNLKKKVSFNDLIPYTVVCGKGVQQHYVIRSRLGKMLRTFDVSVLVRCLLKKNDALKEQGWQRAEKQTIAALFFELERLVKVTGKVAEEASNRAPRIGEILKRNNGK